MAKKTKEIIEKNVTESLDDIMSLRFGAYSKYIIQERALPDARDGLKPVQRRILYSMYMDGNTSVKPHRKSAKAVGQVMGIFHPHGDSSIYEAMVRLSQDWKNNLTLIDMHGNNGSIDDDPPAAYRYTEVRLDKNAEKLLNDIDKNTVTMTNNYDDSTLEPTVLPASYPLLLVNGSTGIASGYATNMAPHNLNEIVDATIYRLNNPECSVEDLMVFVKGPDFPTGGIVQGLDNIKEVFKTGRGKVVLRSKCEVLKGKTNDSIVVTEIPYEVIKCNLVKKINDIAINKDIEGISEVRDESGRDGLKIVIELKKDANSEMILNYLYKNTDLQINYSYNNIAIVNHRPTLLSLSDALDAFIDFRKQVVLNRSVYLRDKKKARLHVIDGLIKAVSILDSVIETIRRSNDKQDSKINLMNNFLFTEEQAEAIVNLRLYRLSNTDIVALKEECSTLIREISELESIISSKEILKSVLTKELKQVNLDNITPRKTKIENEVSDLVIDKLAMVPNESCYISLTRDGYVKRFSKRTFDANLNSLPFTKESDVLLGISACETLDTLLVFTSKGNYLYIPVYKLQECKYKDIGKHVSTYVKLEGNEKVVGALIVKSFETYAFVVLATKNGMIKKTSIPKFDISRFSKAIPAIKLKENDELVSVNIAYENDNVVVVSKSGNYNRYSLEMLSDIAPRAMGVGGINVKNDELAGVAIEHSGPNELLLCSNKGYKRIHFADLDFTSRNAKGNRLFKQTKTNPSSIIGVKTIASDTSLIYNDEKMTILPASSIPFMGLDATFSSVGEVLPFIKDDMSDIPVVDMVMIPESYYKHDDENKEYTQTDLFD